MLKLLLLSMLFVSSIYNISYTNIDGNTVSLNAYQGKKILLVNIATGSNKVGQLAQLQQLQLQYQDSLVVIAFPSNSFNHEPQTNAQIKQFCHDNYNNTFLLGQKIAVTGSGIHPLYNWLASSSENGVMPVPISTDFQKILISGEGALIGVFAPTITPMDSTIINAITGN